MQVPHYRDSGQSSQRPVHRLTRGDPLPMRESLTCKILLYNLANTVNICIIEGIFKFLRGSRGPDMRGYSRADHVLWASAAAKQIGNGGAGR